MMHELSLVNELLDIVNQYEQTYHFEKVKSLKLLFGRLSSIDPGALQFAFDVQSRGTKAQDATLIFDIRPVVIRCLTCNQESVIERYPAPCPECLSDTVILTGGTESLRFLEMDVD